MAQKSKLVLDTNIFIHGWFFEVSNCEKILELVRDSKVYLAFSQETIGELLYVVKNFSRHYISDVNLRISLLSKISQLFYYASSVNTMDTKVEKSNDPYDDMLLECAIESNADYLITDDFKHGLHERDYEGLIICSSEEFIQLFYENEEE